MTTPRPKVRVAIVLLTDVQALDANRLVGWVRRKWEGFRLQEPEPGSSPSRGVGSVEFFRTERDRLMVAVLAGPVPWSDLAGPLADNVLGWKDGAEACRSHKAHVVVSLLSSDRDVLDQHLLLTDLTAAVCRTVDTLAAYWGPGGVVVSARTCERTLELASRDHLPLHMWVSFNELKTPDGALLLATRGLREFDLMEIEARTRRLPVHHVCGKVYDLASYLCSLGPVVKDGDTIGQDDRERIRVRHGISALDRDRTVYRVEVDGPWRSRAFWRIRALLWRRRDG